MKDAIRLKHGLASFSLIVAIAMGPADPLQAGEHRDKANPKYKTTTELEWAETGIGPVVSPIQGNFAETGHITYFRFLPGGKNRTACT